MLADVAESRYHNWFKKTALAKLDGSIVVPSPSVIDKIEKKAAAIASSKRTCGRMPAAEASWHSGSQPTWLHQAWLEHAVDSCR